MTEQKQTFEKSFQEYNDIISKIESLGKKLDTHDKQRDSIVKELCDTKSELKNSHFYQTFVMAVSLANKYLDY